MKMWKQEKLDRTEGQEYIKMEICRKRKRKKYTDWRRMEPKGNRRIKRRWTEGMKSSLRVEMKGNIGNEVAGM